VQFLEDSLASHHDKMAWLPLAKRLPALKTASPLLRSRPGRGGCGSIARLAMFLACTSCRPPRQTPSRPMHVPLAACHSGVLLPCLALGGVAAISYLQSTCQSGLCVWCEVTLRVLAGAAGYWRRGRFLCHSAISFAAGGSQAQPLHPGLAQRSSGDLWSDLRLVSTLTHQHPTVRSRVGC
jgi:hypothetical protein